MDGEAKMRNINSEYLSDDQIKLYLEACLDHKITDFEVINDPNQDKKFDYNNSQVFQRLKDSKIFPDQDNLFYRVWIYQYEGLKELLSLSENQINYRDNISNGKNYDDVDKNTDKEKKILSFRFTFGSIDLKDLQKENLFYREFKKNPNLNFDECRPTDKLISDVKKNLNIVFLYVNLGVPLLEDDLDTVESGEGGEIDKDKNYSDKNKYRYKYEFDIDRIVYFRKIRFSLYEKNERIDKNCGCRSQTMDWILEDKNTGTESYACSKCLVDSKKPGDYKIRDNLKYSIKYFLYCNEKNHNTKKYEYYCKECKRPYCIKCLSNQHKELNETHNLLDIEGFEFKNDRSSYNEKIRQIQNKMKINDEKWQEINNAGDNAERSLRKRECDAIRDVKNEVLARCTYLTSLGHELQRMIAELDFKKKFIKDLREESNVATYLNMNNMFFEDLKNHYIPNLENIERIDLDKFLETFHKIDKKYPEQKDDEEEEEEMYNFEEDEDNDSKTNKKKKNLY